MTHLIEVFSCHPVCRMGGRWSRAEHWRDLNHLLTALNNNGYIVSKIRDSRGMVIEIDNEGG